MTIWLPQLSQSDGPLYKQIADQLQRDVEEGLLLPGSRLPTQRELARQLGITVVTVTRAFNEAAERGVVESTVGRGSFVRERRDAATVIDLSTNVIQGGSPVMSAALAARIAVAMTMPYGIGPGSERHRAAGASWIARARSDAHASRVIVTAGAQQAILIAFAALLEPGELVLTEEVTYHWMRSAAEMLHARIEGVAVDRHGMLPDALAKAARKRGAKVVYVTPTLQNPTGSVMPEKRRRDLAAVAERHGLTIIEDDVYGFLAEKAPPALTSFAPGIFVTGLGKSVAPALRVGYLLAPDALMPRLESLLNASTLFTSPIVAEIAASAIEDGTAGRLAAQRRDAIALRGRVARKILGRHAGSSDARSPHLWIPLPQRWTSESFAAAARARGVRVATASQFAMTKEVPNAIRISIGAPSSAGELETALRALDSLREGEEITRAAAAAV
jgi:DNA-binding transcriptional MocR family regulator